MNARLGGRIELIGLTKSYGAQPVLKGIDLVVDSGEFFSLLGPSGCGKTTTLRLIGGFEANESGSILIDGADIAAVPPEKRPVNTVFQSYALFPHLDVESNVAFGLRFEDCSKQERRRRVGEALELVRLGEYASRKPHQLSGGQQQRVALARALVLRPRVLLLDEPLGALDAQLRRTLQLELKALHREVGITFLYVTHDQEEALTMSDRLAVMRAGEIEQLGTPTEVYTSPVSTYVAEFLGLANLLPVSVVDTDVVEFAGHRIGAATNDETGPRIAFARPERLRISEIPGGSPTVDRPDVAVVPGRITDVVFVGSTTQFHIDVAGHTVQVVRTNDGDGWVPGPGTTVGVEFARAAMRLLPR